LESLAAHDLVVVCDADVRAPRDFLASFVAPFRDPAVGLNSAFYRLATSATAAMRWEALAVNADFWSSVLQARRLGPMRFALGAALALRRSTLARAGSFAALMDFLADDYELGRRVAVLGGRVELSPVVVECREAPCGWSEIWRHQLRWARTIRYCQPLPYAFSLLSNPTLWPLLWLVVAPGFPAVVGAGACLTVRLAMAAHCQRRMTRSWSHLPWLWLAPVKDLLGVALWFFAFLGNQVEWRGERLTVRRGGRIVPAA
jgi:ceramide glucosyltransferase